MGCLYKRKHRLRRRRNGDHPNSFPRALVIRMPFFDQVRTPRARDRDAQTTPCPFRFSTGAQRSHE